MESRFDSHYSLGVLDELPRPKPPGAGLRRGGAPVPRPEARPQAAFALRGCVGTPDKKIDRGYFVV